MRAQRPRVRLKFRARVNPPRTDVAGVTRDTEVSFVPMDAVGTDGRLRLDATRPVAELLQGYTAFRNGDVLIAKITPCFENGKGAVAAGLKNGVGFGTTELHVLRPTGSEPRYLFYTTLSHDFRVKGEAEMYGSAGQKRLPESFVCDFPIVDAPLDLQRAVADFLDARTAAIDALIAKKERLVELLTTRRHAFVTEAVTRGLSKSGVERYRLAPWFGRVPAHWEVSRLKWVCSRIADCPHATPVYSEDGEHPVVRTSDMDWGTLDLSCARRVDHEQYLRRTVRLVPREGDIFYSREGERYGRAALAPNVSVCLGQRMMHFRTGAQADPGFLMWQLNSHPLHSQASQDVLGATSPHVNVETIRNFVVVVPPLDEQRALAEHIDRATSEIDVLRATLSSHIQKLSQFRMALISAAVAGQIDVRAERAEVSV